MRAANDIKTGSIWWKPIIGKNIVQLNRSHWKTFVNSEIQLSKHSNIMYNFWISSTYYDKESDCLNFVCDSARFIRHSTCPNSKLTKEGRIAIKDIKEGDEITENFLEYDKYPWPELWGGPIEQHGDESVKKSYLAAHPEDLVVTTELMEKPKYYIAEANFMGLGSYVGIGQKTGSIYQQILPNNQFHIPKEAWISIFNSKRTDLCQSFCDSVLKYGWYMEKTESLDMWLDNFRFINHSFDANVKFEGTSLKFLRDIEPGEQLLIDYSPEVTLPCPWATFRWEFLVTKK